MEIDLEPSIWLSAIRPQRLSPPLQHNLNQQSLLVPSRDQLCQRLRWKNSRSVFLRESAFLNFARRTTRTELLRLSIAHPSDSGTLGHARTSSRVRVLERDRNASSRLKTRAPVLLDRQASHPSWVRGSSLHVRSPHCNFMPNSNEHMRSIIQRNAARSRGWPAKQRSPESLGNDDCYQARSQMRIPSIRETRTALPQFDRAETLVWRRARPSNSVEATEQRSSDSSPSSLGHANSHVDSARSISSSMTQASVSQITKMDPGLLDRLTDDVIRRVDQRMRIERQRRGL